MSDMHDPRPSSPHWPTTVLPTVPAHDKHQKANRVRLIVLGAAGGFLLLAIGYWAFSGSGDDNTAPVAAPVTSVQVLRTQSIEPLEESSVKPTSKPPTTKPTTKPAVPAGRPGLVIAQMQRELGVLVRNGQLDRDDARSLNQRLRKVSESIRKNDADQADDRLGDFADKLADLHDDGKISDAGFNALAAQAAQVAAALSN
ncbi:hypothetical protein [Actinoplanes sp. L3-i22]|uniref:FIMAH domain-containing protein n=1 Tax=Actinoplanes sp. L3-i22 TaxID=2836373 RepID=UPI001C84576E|nr:hypothetical protein [Actinoplanes sp. L3-i22]